MEKNTLVRIKEFIDFIDVSVAFFEKSVGMSNGSFASQLKNNKTIGVDKIENILRVYPQINPEWLLTGKGEMIKNKKTIEKDIRRNLIPLYNDVATIGGVNNLGANLDAVSHTTEYIDAGDWFPGATAAIRHYGPSMVEYPSGSILALKKVEDVRLLLWGRNYCVETTEYRITKRLNTSKKIDYITGHSSNKEVSPNGSLIHEPIEIPTELIRSIYQVLGCVTKEYSNGVVEIAKK